MLCNIVIVPKARSPDIWMHKFNLSCRITGIRIMFRCNCFISDAVSTAHTTEVQSSFGNIRAFCGWRDHKDVWLAPIRIQSRWLTLCTPSATHYTLVLLFIYFSYILRQIPVVEWSGIWNLWTALVAVCGQHQDRSTLRLADRAASRYSKKFDWWWKERI